ncbi:MAG: hypothetical protein RL516_1027 [Bacteroidota bacterium]
MKFTEVKYSSSKKVKVSEGTFFYMHYICKMKKSITAFIFCLISLVATAQYNCIEIKCDCDNQNCDTLSITTYNRQEQLIKKIKFSKIPTEPTLYISYDYNSNGQLTRKVARNKQGNLIWFNKLYYQYNKTLFADTLFKADSTLKIAFLHVKDTASRSKVVYWSFVGDSVPSVEQRIVLDSLGNEFLNTTCYSPNDCITYKSYYKGKTKTNTEVWVLKSEKPVPTLTEMEDYILDDKNRWRAMSKINSEGKCNEHYFYTYSDNEEKK